MPSSPSGMPTSRLEAFSDGVFAIIITIMVLELRAPHDPGLGELHELFPALLSYVLSFLYVGIYWNNHHHLLHVTQHVSGPALWANLHLLFWLSLIPFVTDWMGQTHFSSWPVVAYGVILLLCAMSWSLLAAVLLRTEGQRSPLARALRRRGKEWLSIALYAGGILLALAGAWWEWGNEGRWAGAAGCAVYAAVAAVWFIPDRRLEEVAAPAGAEAEPGQPPPA